MKLKQYCLSMFLTLIMTISSYGNTKEKSTLFQLKELEYIVEEFPSMSKKNEAIVDVEIVKLLEEVWRLLNLEKKKIVPMPWARAYQTALKKDNVVLFSVARTQERESLFKWACPITSAQYSLLARKEKNIEINSIQDLRLYKIGTLRDDVSEQLLKKMFNESKVYNHPNIHSNVSIEALIHMLDAGRLDLVGSAPSILDGLITSVSTKDYEDVYSIGRLELCFAFSRNVSMSAVKLFEEKLREVLKRPEFKHLS